MELCSRDGNGAKNLPLNVPCDDFSRCDVAEPLAASLSKCKAPTDLQRFAVPVALAGRDLVIVGVGRGLAMSFAVPAVNALLQPGAGSSRAPGGLCAPRVLMLAPTREVCADLDEALHELTTGLPVQHTVSCGGVPLDETLQALSAPANIGLLVATPRRVTDLIERGALTLSRVSLLVLAAADALVDLGFEGTLGGLVGRMPKPHERQVLASVSVASPALSATLASHTKPDAIHLLTHADEPWRAACSSALVTQHVCYAEERTKQALLVELVRAAGTGLVLVVAGSRRACEMVRYNLRDEHLDVVDVHVEKTGKSKERDAALREFASGATPVLITTSGSLRTFGAELPPVDEVISFDFPTSLQARTHRRRAAPPVAASAPPPPPRLPTRACPRRSTPTACSTRVGWATWAA